MNVSKFQFQNPILTKINFNINKDFAKEDDDIAIESSMEIGVSRKENEPIANVSLNVTIGKNDNTSPFYVDCEMVAGFSWEENAYDEETISSLLTMNAPALLLSYIRPIVAQITNLSQYPSYNIPYFNFLPKEE